MVDCNGVDLKGCESCPMTRMVEKPAVEDVPSNFAVVGCYVLSHRIWDKLAMIPPGAGDEIQLTDAIDILMQDETVKAFHMAGRSHDCGDKLGYAKLL